MLTAMSLEGVVSLRGKSRVPKFPEPTSDAHWRNDWPTRMGSASSLGDHWPAASVPCQTRTYQTPSVAVTPDGMSSSTVTAAFGAGEGLVYPVPGGFGFRFVWGVTPYCQNVVFGPSKMGATVASSLRKNPI